MKTKTTLLLTLLLLFSVFLYASELTGDIRDSKTNEPLIGATVVIEGTTIGAITDLNGHYEITGIKEGQYVFVASYMGYEDLQVSLSIPDNGEVKHNFKLVATSVALAEVVVSIQAQGQLSALNQQINAGYVSNHVSSERLQEVPDATIAESLSRLPGVAVTTSAGEGDKVVIRGMESRFSLVTVDGVRMPSTGKEDNSVGMAGVSPFMIDGIEVQKSITPDKDADATGGIVDLKLKDAPEGFHANVVAQNNFNSLVQDYFNPRLSLTLSNRLLDNKLGIIATGNFERVDRASHRMQNNYNVNESAPPAFTEFKFQSNEYDRSRSGGSVYVDYRLPQGKIKARTFITSLGNDEFQRAIKLEDGATGGVNKDYYNHESSEVRSINSLQLEHNLPLGAKIHVQGAYTTGSRKVPMQYNVYSRNSTINNSTDTAYFWDEVYPMFSNQIDQEQAVIYPEEILQVVPYYDPDGTSVYRMNSFSEKFKDDELMLELDLEIPYRISNALNGKIKFGGKYRKKNRKVEATYAELEFNNGDNRLVADTIAAVFPEYNLYRVGSDLATSALINDYSETILDGTVSDQYWNNFMDPDKLDAIMLWLDENQWAPKTDEALHEANTHRDDYSGNEQVLAAYLMGDLNFTRYINLTGGVRFEKINTKYHGYGAVWTTNPATAYAIDFGESQYDSLTKRENTFILPMVNVKIKPFDWMHILVAYTQTIARPKFYSYLPRFVYFQQTNAYGSPNPDPAISYYGPGNPALKPALTHNFDARITLNANNTALPNWLGVFTAGVFYKEIIDLEVTKSFNLYGTAEQRDSTNSLVPYYQLFDLQNQRAFDWTYNNPWHAFSKGIEIEWQSSFWSLPSPFNGLVINANYTRNITKKTEIREKELVTIPPGSRRPVVTYVDTTFKTRLYRNPDYTINVTLGYDYKGLSFRVGYRHTAESFSGNTGFGSAAQTPEGTKIFASQNMWDLSLAQKIPWIEGLQIFLNVSNLTATYGEKEISKRSDSGAIATDNEKGSLPWKEEYYGRFIIAGLRYSF